MKKIKVRIPTGSSPVSISYGGSEPVDFKDSDGIVQLDPEQVDLFLRAVPGAEVVDDAPAGQAAKK